MDYFLEETEPKFQLVLNTFSLICATVVLILLGAIAFLYKDLFDRVTIRFQGLIAVVDIFRHVNVYFYSSLGGSLCMASGFLSVFGDPLYIFLGVAVAMNLHIIGIKSIIPSPKTHVWMLVFIAILLFAMNLGAYAFGVIGKDSDGNCALLEGEGHSWIPKLLLVYLPIIPGMFYCTYVSIKLIFKFWKDKDTNQESMLTKVIVPKDSRITIVQFIRKLYLRAALIPLFCAFNLAFYILANLVYEFWDYDKNILSVLSRTCLRLAGTLNLVSFVLDPYFHIAVQRFVYGKNNDILQIDAEKGFSLSEGTYSDPDGYYVNDPNYVPDKEDLELLAHHKNLKLS